jgi:hypothetical protein
LPHRPRHVVSISLFSPPFQFPPWEKKTLQFLKFNKAPSKYLQNARESPTTSAKGNKRRARGVPSMVHSTAWVVVVARTSADLCQYAACNPERLSSDETLDAIFCLPMRVLSRFAGRVFSFFCFPLYLEPNPRRPFIQYNYTSSSSFSDSGSSVDEGYYSGGVSHYHSD